MQTARERERRRETEEEGDREGLSFGAVGPDRLHQRQDGGGACQPSCQKRVHKTGHKILGKKKTKTQQAQIFVNCNEHFIFSSVNFLVAVAMPFRAHFLSACEKSASGSQ